MQLYTERCQIRPFKEDDLDAFMEYRNNAVWMEYQGFKNLSKEKYRQTLLREISFEEGVQLAIIHSETNKLIGDFYLKQENKACWIGYTISPAFSKKGYAYEVCMEMLNYLRDQAFSVVYAGVHPANQASIHLLKKLGFTDGGTDEYGDLLFQFIF